MPSAQDCPYFILDRGKVTQVIADISPVNPGLISVDLPAPNPFSITPTKARLPDSTGLYLRVRVLLI